jgi:hypothetical protein
MKKHLLTTPLVTTVLLLSTLGCSKKQDAPTPEVNTASYIMAGQSKTCQAAAALSSTAGQDYLSLSLTTTPQPTSGPEWLSIGFAKSTGQPTSAYQLQQIYFYTNKRLSITFPDAVATVTSASNGSISGTFSADGYNPIYAAYFTNLKKGVFTNVQL